MLFTLAPLLLVTLSPAVNQQHEVPTFLIETVSGQDGAPLANCEVLVLDETMSDRDQDFAHILKHGLQLAERLEIMGTRWRTDESGRLNIPTPPGDFMISATHNSGLVAYQGWIDPQRDGHQKLYLFEPRIAEVRCVDEDGEPLMNIPVVMTPGGFPFALSRKLTDETGRVRFSDLGLYETAAEMGLFAELELVVAIPLQDDLRVPIAEALTTEDPVEFRLPALGAVEIKIPAGWHPSGSLIPALSLQNASGGDAPVFAPIPTDLTGTIVVRFPHVGLNQSLTVAILDHVREPELQQFQGPTQPGQIVKIALDVPGQLRSWCLRALDPSGEPIANARFTGLFDSQEDGYRGADAVEFRSDRDGYIDLPILTDHPYQGQHELLLRLAHEERPQRLEARIDARDLVTRVPLKVVFEAPHVFAAGQVVDTAGAPIIGATIFMHVPRDPLSSDSWWTEPRIFLDHLRTDENGRFKIWSTESRSPLRITAERGGYDDGTADAEDGATDVRIVLKRRGEVTGRLLLDDTIHPYGLSVGLISKKYGNDWQQPDEQGRFRFSAVGNGKSMLQVSAWGGYTRFYSIDLEVREGDLVDDAGIREIDLRGKIFPIKISMKLLDGQKCDGFTIRPKDGDISPRCDVWSDSKVLLVDEIPVDLEVSKAGYRTVTLSDVADDVVVEMAVGVLVEVSVDHPEWIPDGWSLRAYFSSPMDPSMPREKIEHTGKTVVALSDPGHYSVYVALLGLKGWSGDTVCRASFETSAEGTTTLMLHLDEDAVREAVGG